MLKGILAIAIVGAGIAMAAQQAAEAQQAPPGCRYVPIRGVGQSMVCGNAPNSRATNGTPCMYRYIGNRLVRVCS
ncbi:hypothetical protein GJW-30_1_00810 [Variibacter gotjawalensis]|uniref:Uncharacterized protein n=1 Tax=Variibacter gotjawalensis TaxID=1333996 RepID=A0A0S3PR73_9BRAD|nr:hypothetical protein [Variibacter gotjawalensis]RZS50452.1 hypothetical protein EV661_2916 [Variibacter gotjawalensis]BAT58286.1 hypothetical protein GJW-30_1_00810 [Variibacter gotjawalensis]